ncbi:16140_t:CDS:2 [Rhizophagus irregularis]|nr:16140_t:CDS:2 [Rhizophagus irregularis]
MHEGLETQIRSPSIRYCRKPATSPPQIQFPNAFERLMDSRLQFPAIWYIDPYLEKLRSSGCHLPSLFNSLPVYQQDANSIELSLAEPWACKASWQEVVSNVFEVTTMMKKYSDHLEATNNNMKRIHESKNPARELSSNCNIRLISIHVGEIDERYSGLDSDLKNKELFDIQLSVPAGLYQHSHGKYLRTLNFIWRAPDTEVACEYYETTDDYSYK